MYRLFSVLGVVFTSLFALVLSQPPAAWVEGLDISETEAGIALLEQFHWGSNFVWIRCTTGRGELDPHFAAHWEAARRVPGLLRGAYHIGAPARSSGAHQAIEFMRHGGRWHNPAGRPPTSFTSTLAISGKYAVLRAHSEGFSEASIKPFTWLLQFIDVYINYSGRAPVIYARPAMLQFCLNHPIPASIDLRGALMWSHGSPAIGTLGREPVVPTQFSNWTFWSYRSGYDSQPPADQACTLHEDDSAHPSQPIPGTSSDPDPQPEPEPVPIPGPSNQSNDWHSSSANGLLMCGNVIRFNGNLEALRALAHAPAVLPSPATKMTTTADPFGPLPPAFTTWDPRWDWSEVFIPPSVLEGPGANMRDELRI